MSDSSCPLHLVVIYRPPPSTVYGFRTSDFLNELDCFLDDILLLPSKLLLVGDMNAHWDRQVKFDVKQYVGIISSANLMQHVNLPTHRSGHILDHVLSYKVMILSLTLRFMKTLSHGITVSNSNQTWRNPLLSESLDLFATTRTLINSQLPLAST